MYRFVPTNKTILIKCKKNNVKNIKNQIKFYFVVKSSTYYKRTIYKNNNKFLINLTY
jgi:hypothetical protein